MKQKYIVSGMTCAACSSRVEKVTRALPGVIKADVNLLGGTMTAEFDEAVLQSSRIIEAVTAAGYDTSLPQAEAKTAAKPTRPDNSAELKSMSRRFWVSLCFLAPLMYLTMGGMVGLPTPSIFAGVENALIFAITQMLMTLPVMIINYKYYQKGFQTLFHGSPNMDSLIAVGSGAAFAYGVFVIYRMAYGMGHGDMELVHMYMHDLYFESAATILTLITLGKYLETRSKGKTGDAIARLLELSPEQAVVERDGVQFEVPIEEVQLGDIIILKPGARVPVDGVVVEGNTAIDQSALTGESLPVSKTVGDRVATATINKTGFVKFKADKIGEDTTLANIIRLVEEAGASKAPIARLADKVAGIFVPVVMIIAAVVFAIWMLLGYGFEFSLTTAIAVLVISCPCALGLATPVAIMVGTGKGAEEGILIKSAEALETLHKVKAIVLDKTGTLTEGKPAVIDIIAGDAGETTLLSVAATLEKPSEHPLSEAIINYAEQKGIAFGTASDFDARSGRGVAATIDGELALGGNAAFMAENGIEIPKAKGEALAADGKTPLYFARGGKFLGLISVADPVKKTSAEAIRRFHDMGIETYMITGDNAVTANAIARSLNIDGVVADVMPEDKEIKVRELQDAGKTVAMVGDGINDALALTRADVGIAIGAGTDVAIESADIVLMKSDLLDAVRAVELSRAVIRNIRMNLFWAFFYNTLGIPVAAGALFIPLGIKLSPMIGAAAMSMSSVCVVTNALRLKFFKASFERDAKFEDDNDFYEIPKGEEKMATVIKVEGMMCAHCKAHVEKALLAVDGVEKAEANVEAKTATVEGNADLAAMKAAIVDAGYEVIG